jgi:hypothetical protein
VAGSAGPSTRRGESYRAGPAVGSGIPSVHMQPHELDPALFKRERMPVGDSEAEQGGAVAHSLFRFSSAAASAEQERGESARGRERYE